MKVAFTLLATIMLSACGTPTPHCGADDAVDAIVAAAQDRAASEYGRFIHAVATASFYARFGSLAEANEAIDNMAKDAAEDADVAPFDANTVSYDETTATYTCSASLRLDMERGTYEYDFSYTVGPSPDSRGLIVHMKPQ